MTLFFDPDWPSSENLDRDPVLAILAALDAVITLALRAIMTTHPYAHDDERPYWVDPPLTPTDRVATDIVLLARQLSNALEAYSDATVLNHPAPKDGDPQNDFPF